MGLKSNQVEARHEATLAAVRRLYEERYPSKEAGVFSEPDWERCRAALGYVRGPSVLEVGVGPGQMFNILARDPGIRRLVGIDITWNQKLIRPEKGELQLMNILRLALPDASFDTVLGMEVLEHLEAIDLQKAVHELRRVCRGTLVMTVPYDEPAPLWHHDRPGGHRQAFPEEKLERIFPRAERRFVARGKNRWPWIMLVERLESAVTTQPGREQG